VDRAAVERVVRVLGREKWSLIFVWRAFMRDIVVNQACGVDGSGWLSEFWQLRSNRNKDVAHFIADDVSTWSTS